MQYRGGNYEVEIGKYSNGRIAIILIEEDTHEATIVSFNPDVDVIDNEVFIDETMNRGYNSSDRIYNNSFNITVALQKANIIGKDIIRCVMQSPRIRPLNSYAITITNSPCD